MAASICVLTPATSCRVLQGRYKWLIYGDDDTLHYPEGIARALETHHLEADLPYFVSGGGHLVALC